MSLVLREGDDEMVLRASLRAWADDRRLLQWQQEQQEVHRQRELRAVLSRVNEQGVFPCRAPYVEWRSEVGKADCEAAHRRNVRHEPRLV